MIFWVITGALAAGISGILAVTLVRGRIGDTSSATYDLRVYRDQLKEIERDYERAVINETEAARLRTEVSRRVLDADGRVQAGGRTEVQTSRAGQIAAVLVGLCLIGGSVWLYTQIGAPGYGDRPMAARIAASDAARRARLTQAQAEAQFATPATPQTLLPGAGASEDYLALMEKLRAAVDQHPDDLRGWILLARNEALLGNSKAAYQAQDRVIALKGADSPAEDYAFLADLMITASGGYVSDRAEHMLRTALKRDPDQAAARYYLGHYFLQVDRPDAAFRLWRGLLEEGPGDAPWVPLIRDQIGAVAQRAGVQYELPPEVVPTPGSPADPGLNGAPSLNGAPRPTPAQVEAMSALDAPDRAKAIRGMVAGLSERLATEGGSAADWARLIRAYGVLGETGRARAIWDEAQQVFRTHPDALRTIRTAADAAGLGQ